MDLQSRAVIWEVKHTCLPFNISVPFRFYGICRYFMAVFFVIIFRFHQWKSANKFHGLNTPIHGRTGMTFTSKRYIEAELWFGELVNSLANVMPDVNRKELPACLTIRKVFEMYKEATGKGKHLKMSQFRRMWKTRFPEVIIPKVRNPRHM